MGRLGYKINSSGDRCERKSSVKAAMFFTTVLLFKIHLNLCFLNRCEYVHVNLVPLQYSFQRRNCSSPDSNQIQIFLPIAVALSLMFLYLYSLLQTIQKLFPLQFSLLLVAPGKTPSRNPCPLLQTLRFIAKPFPPGRNTVLFAGESGGETEGRDGNGLVTLAAFGTDPEINPPRLILRPQQ